MTGSERGSGSLLVAAAVLVIAVAASVVVLAGSALLGVQRVRAAADLVAVSAAAALFIFSNCSSRACIKWSLSGCRRKPYCKIASLASSAV